MNDAYQLATQNDQDLIYSDGIRTHADTRSTRERKKQNKTSQGVLLMSVGHDTRELGQDPRNVRDEPGVSIINRSTPLFQDPSPPMC